MGDLLFCRLCALKTDRFVSIYGEEGHKLSIQRKISKCLQIQVYQTDSLPKCVCLDCCFKLDQFSTFMESSASAQDTLHRLFQQDDDDQDDDDDVVNGELKDVVINSTEPHLELTPLDCNSTYQVLKDYEVKEYGANDQQLDEQVEVNHRHHHDHNRCDGAVVTNAGADDRNSADIVFNGTANGDCHGEEGEDEEDEDIDDDEYNDDDDLENRNVRIIVGQNEIIASDISLTTTTDDSTPPGFGDECLIKDSDNLSSKRKRTTPMKCFNIDTNNMTTIKLKRRNNFVKKELQQQHEQQSLAIEQRLIQQQQQHQQQSQATTDQIALHNNIVNVIEYNAAASKGGDEFRDYHNSGESAVNNDNNEQDLLLDDNKSIIGVGNSDSNNSSSNSAIAKEWDQMNWLCTDCPQELDSVESLKDHHSIVHKQPCRYVCNQCNKVYTQYHCFFTHVKRHRNLVKYSCEECGKCFSNKKVLDMHLATHSGTRPYVCSVCGKSFRQQSALYIHGRCHLPEDVKNKFACDECDKRFSTKPNLVTHKRIHTGVRNFTCDQCGKSFIQKGNLDAHLVTHSQDKPFSCDLCSKGFKTSMQLRKHHTVHTGAKPHQCDVCGRTFRERGTLREHHRIHTGAMPFTCEFCGKAFRFKGILTTHRRQHTGERPYSCLECQHHFTNWPNYNKHMKRRHGINTSRTTRVKTTPAIVTELPVPSSNDPSPVQQQTTNDAPPPLYEDSIATTSPPEDLSDRVHSGDHYYPPQINVSMTTPMTTAAYHVTTTPHPNAMLSFYNLPVTQIQSIDPNGTVNAVINTPLDVLHTVQHIPQQVIHH